jgi:hypothetical protein
MFDSAHAVPARTVTSTIAAAAATIAFRDNSFFIVILLEIIDAPHESCRSRRRQSLNRVSLVAPRVGNGGTPYERQRSRNVRESVRSRQAADVWCPDRDSASDTFGQVAVIDSQKGVPAKNSVLVVEIDVIGACE